MILNRKLQKSWEHVQNPTEQKPLHSYEYNILLNITFSEYTVEELTCCVGGDVGAAGFLALGLR